MPDILLKNQCFDLAFHPAHDQVYAGLLTGEIKGFSYDDAGDSSEAFTVRPTKRSCRGLAIDKDGSQLFAVTKDKTLHTIDPRLGKVIDTKAEAHDSPINRVVTCMPQMIATGDDDGIVKLWDPRVSTHIRAYTRHFDFISDFLWLEDKKSLVSTSGDGTLTVMDVRAKKTEPIAQSIDQEDEMLSIAAIKQNSKIVVGTQLGMLSVFNRKSGWDDCVDRVPGHPQSVDAIATITDDVIATGSSDGFIRMVQILPNKLLGVVGDHGEFPVERLKLSRDGKWLGSASHDEILKLTDVGNALEDSDEDDDDTRSQTHQSESVDGPSERETPMPEDLVVSRTNRKRSAQESDENEEDLETTALEVKQGGISEPPARDTNDDPSSSSDLEPEIEVPKKKQAKKRKKSKKSRSADVSGFFSGL
ncbi:WD repeat-containing protein jip5 [Tulasnella sp. 418]|nr:WD repeat-containing protein jip5 [Tulasnella sp. 418]